MKFINETERPPVTGFVCIAFLLRINEFPATPDRKASTSYVFQVPYNDGSVLKHTFYGRRDGGPVGKLEEGNWYLLPFEAAVKRDKSGISLTLTGEASEPPR